jgi:hypothetical protein
VSGFASRQRFIGLGLLLLTFTVGGFAGAAVKEVRDRQAMERLREERRNRQPFSLRSALNLTPEQRVKWDTIMAKREREMKAVWAVHGPQLDSIVKSARAELRLILEPDQVARWDTIRAAQRSRDHDRNQQNRPPGDRQDKRP